MSDSANLPPLVAVVTPVYNGAEFLERTLASVQQQTYANLIHIVLDNASADETPAIIKRHLNGPVPIETDRNPTILPLQQNWNAAVSRVPRSAKYFQILCADDELTPESISKLVALAETDPGIELVGCKAWRNEELRPSSLPETQMVFEGADIARSYLEKKTDDIPYTFGLYRRRNEDFEKPFFDETLFAIDTDACLRAMARGKYGFVHEPLFQWRRHANQVSNTLIKQNQARVFEPLILIERWGPKVMPAAALKKCRDRHLYAIYRHLLAWRLLGRRELFDHYVALLKERELNPHTLQYLASIAAWPSHLLSKHARQFWLNRQPANP